MSDERKAHSSEEEGFGPNSKAMMDLASSKIAKLLDDPVTSERARNSMSAVLTGAPANPTPEAPNFTKAELDEGKVFGGYFALISMKISLRECEYYFRRYPFRGMPISKADHFRNVCEMYFDRVVQFRDRAKALMNAIKATPGGENIAIKQFLKAFDKTFDWEIRNRNAVHHHGRFEYDAIEKMSIAHLLRHHSGIHGFIQPERVYREERRKWIERVRHRALVLDQFIEAIAKFILDNCDFALAFKEDAKTKEPVVAPTAGLPHAIEEAAAEAP